MEVEGRMMSRRRGVALLVVLLLSAGCALNLPIGPAPSGPGDDVLYLNLVWHQHQPLYYKDSAGVYTRPWARAHATKDYYDMAATVAKYPDVHVTFNLTPVLIRQLDDLAAGAKDAYRAVSEVPADQLTQDQKRFLLERFFDANWDHVIARYPRYQALLDLRGPGAEPDDIDAALQRFSTQDYRDLQVWWNLAWFDPGFLAEPPLNALVEKGRGFAESDKPIIFEQVDRIVADVIPLHKQLQDDGQIEVIVTPYAHPILPLLYATDLAAVGDPSADLPDRFSYPNDAIAQVSKAVDVYEGHFGRPPRGMWPAEGAVADEIVKFVADAGFVWMATGEPVLARSLGMSSFSRDSQDVVQEADALYRPYYVQFRDGPKVAVVFRDGRLSDMVGFEYSGDPGEAAAADFMDRLEAIRAELIREGAEGPHLVSVILDGENAWENYDNDGIEFLNALYRDLSQSQTVHTITPSEYLSLFPEQRSLDNLWPGAWFSSDYSTWIGEPEENSAWNALGRTRKALAAYDMTGKKTADPQALAQALDSMYLAEGSDWFWWYGSDQDSGDDRYFDEAFRALLKGVYTSLGEPVPDFVRVPIIPDKPVAPNRNPGGATTPAVDGRESEGEWAEAALYGPTTEGHPISDVYVGYDKAALYLRVDADREWSSVEDGNLEVYLSREAQPAGSAMSLSHASPLGFGAGFAIQVEIADGKISDIRMSGADPDGGWSEPDPAADVRGSVGGSILEMALPFDVIGEAIPGEVINLRAIWRPIGAAGGEDAQVVPAAGPARLILPDLSQVTYFLQVDDPQGDDHGPGTYTYPTDPVFKPGVFDIKTFSAGVDGDEFVFRFDLYGPVNNPWDSGIQLSVQTFDVYIDFDPGEGTGARGLLEGRNASLAEGDGWDMAVWVEGWQQRVFAVGPDGTPQEVSGDLVRVIVDPQGSVTFRVKASAVDALGAHADSDWTLDPKAFGYLGVLLSQEGYPSPGVRRVRDVEPEASQWRMGGAPADTNHTRIVDLALPAASSPSQEAWLSDYPSSNAPVGDLDPDDFAQLPLVEP
jgi:alpha-amylase/alpha-mannosidase (GH57 family)